MPKQSLHLATPGYVRTARSALVMLIFLDNKLRAEAEHRKPGVVIAE